MLGETAKTSARVLSDVVIIQKNGTIIRTPPRMRTPMKRARRVVRSRLGQGDCEGEGKTGAVGAVTGAVTGCHW